MARRGLQALHEICAGDPEGVAVNLLDAHLRSNTTEAVTVDDVSEQMSLLGISDKSLAWIGARAALWRRADWARYRTAEGHLYYLRDDGVSQWEHPLQNELRQLYDAARAQRAARDAEDRVRVGRARREVPRDDGRRRLCLLALGLLGLGLFSSHLEAS